MFCYCLVLVGFTNIHQSYFSCIERDNHAIAHGWEATLMHTNKYMVNSRKWACLVTWFCYHLIGNPGNKTCASSWPSFPIGSDVIQQNKAQQNHVHMSWDIQCLIHLYNGSSLTTKCIMCIYSISQEICTRFLLCCALLWLYIDWFSHIHQAYFTGTVAI